MENVIINGEIVDKEITLAEMRQYLLEWYKDGIAEHIYRMPQEEVYFEDYDKMMTIKDVSTNEDIFYAVFHHYDKADDSSKVYLSGVVNEELRGIIGKIIDLDKQLEESKKATQSSQKGE